MQFSNANRREERFARQTEQLHAEILASGLPLYTLSASTRPAPDRFGGMEIFDGTVTAVHLVYPPPTPVRPWADVETARWTGLRIGPALLRLVLEHHVRLGEDRFSELTWTESTTTLLVDGHPVDADRLDAGDRWWALRGKHSGIEITVVGRDWHPETIAVETVGDPVPILKRIDEQPHRTTAPSAHPEPLPADMLREPHQAMIDAVLRNSAAQIAWQADGGAAPELPGWWSDLWHATVQRQMRLSGQPEPEAAEAVRSMTSHLASLVHDVAWLRTYDELRRRAVTETLFYTTGLRTDVPSRPAHDEWQRSTDRTATAHARAAANQRWHSAWESWASAQPQP